MPIHHHWKYCVPSATIEPHSAVGGCAPSPRNESPDSSRIAVARSSVASTNTGPATFGSTSRTSVAAARRAEQPRGLDVLGVTDRQHEPADDARVRRPGDDDDRERGVREPASEHRRDHHGEDDRREGEDEVRAAHEHPVRDAAEVARGRADDASDRHGEEDEDERDRDGHARAVDHAAEDVAAELVRPEVVVERRRQRRRKRLGQRIVGRDQRREDGDDEPADGDDRADDRQRLPPRRRQERPVPRRDRQRELVDLGELAHVIRIRGSMMP